MFDRGYEKDTDESAAGVILFQVDPAKWRSAWSFGRLVPSFVVSVVLKGEGQLTVPANSCSWSVLVHSIESTGSRTIHTPPPSR